MKPLQVVLLVVVSAVAGGLFMKWEIGRGGAEAPTKVAAAANPVASAPLAPVAAQQSQSAEPVEPPPVPVRKVPVVVHREPVVRTKPHEVLKSQRVEPTMVARNEELPVQPVVEAPTALVAAQQVTPTPPDSQPIPAYPEPSQQLQQPEPAVSLPAAPPTNQVTLKAGMVIAVRTGEGLSSNRNSPGDGFTATLDQPVVVDGWVIAEKGSRVEGKVIETGGKTQPELVVALTQLRTSDGQRVAIETDTYARHAQMANGDTAGKVIAGTVIGAAIGAIAGGGKGAAIGAGVGTAAGAGTAAATRSRPAVLPAESLVRFRLKNSVTITERQGRS